MREKVLLKVKRFYQRGNQCGVAACSSLANYYNPSVKYKDVRKTVDPVVMKRGMHTAEEAILLNSLGITCVSIVTADTDAFDFSWQKRSRNWKIKRLKKLRSYYKRNSGYSDDDVDFVTDYINFLESKDFENNLIIDWDFPRWIKSSIRKNHPVIASINYTSYFKMPKEKDNGFDDIKGEAAEHAFVIRGFDKEYIYVVDSSGKRTEKYNGYYGIKWEHFLVNIGTGDLILTE